MGKKRFLFRRQQTGSNPYRVLFLLVLVLGSVFLLRGYGEGSVKPLHEPTPTPTRVPDSHALEGEVHFHAGNLNSAIEAYRKALQQSPNNGHIWAELARIQVYSSRLLTTDALKKQRLQEALESANMAVKTAPEDSTASAVRAFVLDWNANPALAGKDHDALLTEAEQEAVRAINLDNQNALALAYYAEILIDQQKWVQAQGYITQAVERDPSLMDVHRVYALLMETLGRYPEAIQSYQRAIEINPNLTFLHLQVGILFRHLKQYEKALDYFAQAATINEQLGVKDPMPYIAIAKTYAQTGDFFIASRNMRKALTFDPTSEDVYGQLGIIYFKSRNYEGAIPALRCAIYGCSAKESCEVRGCNESKDPPIELKGMPLSGNTLVYYYTYGSVLAGMHRAGLDNCALALKTFDEVRKQYANDATIMQIVQASEQICASFGVTR